MRVLFHCFFGLCFSMMAHATPPAYELQKSFTVEGRQGIAVDDQYYYVSGSTSLYKYDKQGKLLLSNRDPFRSYAVKANHIGDIDVYNGEIYLGVEWFVDGRGKDLQITVHDAKTLAYKRSFPFQASSGQLEVSGITIDRKNKTVWMCSWVGGESGRHLYEYDLQSGKYLRKIAMNPAPQWIQGIFYHDGALFLTADDGDAEKDKPDHLYKVSLEKGKEGTTTLEKTFTEFKRTGEIEGLAFDGKKQEWLIHHNRGKRIIKGMPKGLYPGYTKEIREVYVFKKASSSK